MSTIEAVIGAIASANNDGVAAFETEIGDRPVSYRLFGHVEGGRLTMRSEPPLAFDAAGAGAEVWDLVPRRVVKRAALRPSSAERAIDRHVELAVDVRVPCTHGTCELHGTYSIWVRDYGIKELRLEAAWLATTSRKVHKHLEAMGVKGESGKFRVHDELGVRPVLRIVQLAGGFTIEVERVELEKRKRPRIDPRYRLVSSQMSADRTFVSYKLEPDVPAGALLQVLRTSSDPYVAARAAFVAGDTRVQAVAGTLRDCARDPLEDDNVRKTCAWALAQLDAR